ncbi:uncharacterized protein LOC134539550 isoform X2 [Bacillus rossius redtenbacheri]|uniref:uncharacterized protein LOC134539550 isoform X2 n=1 Tax=Bacillus rossius redtenbacheri TaxID=93214 RepID=UPI002FDD35A8
MDSIPDAILQETYERRCTLGRAELLVISALTKGADNDELGAATHLGWRAHFPTHLDLTIRRAKTNTHCTDVIVESWTPFPPEPPPRPQKKLLYERDKDYFEPYMDNLHSPKKGIESGTAPSEDSALTFEKTTYYYEPYVEELLDVKVAPVEEEVPEGEGGDLQPSGELADGETGEAELADGETREAEPDPDAVDVNNREIQTAISLGDNLLSESLASMDDDSVTVIENGDEDNATTASATEESVADRELIIKTDILDPMIKSVGLGGKRKRGQMATKEDLQLFDEPRVYYEPYMNRLAKETDVTVSLSDWDDQPEPDIAEEPTLPMWDKDLKVPQDGIPQQFDEDWEWLVKNNESLFLGKDYEAVLDKFSMDPCGEFGFVCGPVPEIRSITSAIAQRSPEIMHLLQKLGPVKSKRWLASIGRELASRTSDEEVDVNGLLTEIFPEVNERTIAVHLPEQSLNGKTLILQFGDMKVIMTCNENSSNSSSVTTKLKLNFSKLVQDSIIRHKIKTVVKKSGLRTVVVLRCKKVFIIAVGANTIVNKGLYLDPREVPRKIVTYQLLKNEEEQQETEQLLVQGGAPFFITVPEENEGGVFKMHGKSVEFEYNTAKDSCESTMLAIGGRATKLSIPFEDGVLSCSASLRYRAVGNDIEDTVQIIDYDSQNQMVFFKVVVGDDIKVVSTKNIPPEGPDMIVNLPFTPGVTKCRIIDYESDIGETIFGTKDISCDEGFQLGPLSRNGQVADINMQDLHDPREHYIFSIDGEEQLRFTRTYIGGEPAVIVNILVPDRDKHLLGLEVVPDKLLFLVLTMFPPQSDLSFDIPITRSGIFFQGLFCCECKDEPDKKPEGSCDTAFKLSYKVFVGGKETLASSETTLREGTPVDLAIPINEFRMSMDKCNQPKIQLKLITEGDCNELSKAIVSVTLGSSLLLLPLRKDSCTEQTEPEAPPQTESDPPLESSKSEPIQQNGSLDSEAECQPPDDGQAPCEADRDEEPSTGTKISMYTKTCCRLTTGPRSTSAIVQGQSNQRVVGSTLVCSKTTTIVQTPLRPGLQGSDEASAQCAVEPASPGAESSVTPAEAEGPDLGSLESGASPQEEGKLEPTPEQVTPSPPADTDVLTCPGDEALQEPAPEQPVDTDVLTSPGDEVQQDDPSSPAPPEEAPEVAQDAPGPGEECPAGADSQMSSGSTETVRIGHKRCTRYHVQVSSTTEARASRRSLGEDCPGADHPPELADLLSLYNPELTPMMCMLWRMQRDIRSLARRSSSRQSSRCSESVAGRRESVTLPSDSCVTVEVLSRSPSTRQPSPAAASQASDDSPGSPRC